MRSIDLARRMTLAVLMGVCALAHPDPAPAFDAATLNEAPRQAWLTNGGTLANQRFSPLDAIDRSNVDRLGAVWRVRLDGSGVGPPFSGESQPIVYDGVIYTVTGADDVFAIDVGSGEILWRYQANLDRAISTVCCGWTSRGVAIGDGKIFIGQLDGKLKALDQETGAVVWSVEAERWQDGFTITSAPLYYDGMVITGFAGAEWATRGRVKAFDAQSGALLWTFYTVPAPGEVGSETWPADSDAWRYGGANVWQTPAVDPDLGLLYFSTGNPGPDFNGSSRPGDNLFSVSIVAIDVRTGAYRWHFQQVHHDIWDYDSPSPVVLFDIDYQGEPRRALAQASKTGWVYILDRVSGEPLIGINETPVPQEPRQATAATQPIPVGDAIVPQSLDGAPFGFPLVNQGRIFTPFWNTPIPLRPGPLGGVNWPPMSYSPDLETLFVCSTDSVGVYFAGDGGDPVPGRMYLGGMFGATEIQPSGVFAAVDVHTNRVKWRQRWSDTCYSGSVATASDLVFTGRNDGQFVAIDGTSGAVLWQFQTGAGANAPATVFEHDGTQYVVLYSAGNLFAGSPGGDSVWLFALDGDHPPASAPGAVTANQIPRTGADSTAGASVYALNCAPCHGESMEGGHGGGPALTEYRNARGAVAAIVSGRGRMPGFASVLSPEEIRDVVAFVIADDP